MFRLEGEILDLSLPICVSRLEEDVLDLSWLAEEEPEQYLPEDPLTGGEARHHGGGSSRDSVTGKFSLFSGVYSIELCPGTI